MVKNVINQNHDFSKMTYVEILQYVQTEGDRRLAAALDKKSEVERKK